LPFVQRIEFSEESRCVSRGELQVKDWCPRVCCALSCFGEKRVDAFGCEARWCAVPSSQTNERAAELSTHYNRQFYYATWQIDWPFHPASEKRQTMFFLKRTMLKPKLNSVLDLRRLE
jgi:hypothetical protein